MRRIKLSLLLIIGCMAMMQPCFSTGTMTNTGSVITLTGTCYLPTSGTYTLALAYVDPDNGFTQPAPFSVTVVLSGNVATITRATGDFPTPATNGYWSLPDAENGSIALTGGPSIGVIYWYHNPDGTLQWDCVALPIWFNSFSGSQSGTSVVLNWQTGLEQNSTFIEVYRSFTNSNLGFYKIGQVTAAGNSSGSVNYTFTDASPDAGGDYYYLKMLNSQGTRSIFSSTIHVGCSGCHFTPPSPVNCNFTISGPNQVCNLETPAAYSLSSAVPNYSTIVWSVDVPSAVKLSTYPSFDRTQVTLIKKNATAAVTLKATMSGCSNVISKVIAMGTPAPVIFTDRECPIIVAWPASAPGATSYQWTLTNASNTTHSYGTGAQFSPYIGDGSQYDISLVYVNACGTSPMATVGNFYCEPGTSEIVAPPVLSPNPSSGVVTVGLAPPPATTLPVSPVKGAPVKSAIASTVQAAATGQERIYQVKVLDAQGVVRKVFSYPQGEAKVSLNISELHSGLYTIQVYNKKVWTSRQLLLSK
jgi:hypothetical protein